MNKIMDKAKEKAHPELLVQRICQGKKMKPSETKRVNKFLQLSGIGTLG